MNLKNLESSKYRGTVRETVKEVEALRLDPNNPVDMSFGDYVQRKHGVSLDSYLLDLGIAPGVDTINNIFTVPDDDVRWVVPEIIRTALLLGYRKAPIWPNIIAAEENTTGLSQILPWINMSDAAPRKVAEAETIPVGTISYGQKKFGIYKIGRGIKIPYEVLQYVSLDVISIFLRDFGVKLGHAMDVLAIDCLINGEQADGSESAPVIGTATGDPSTKAYKDFLKIWIRLSRMGRLPNTIIGGEDAALATLDLTEFKTPVVGVPAETLIMKTPIPQSTNYYIHGNIPTNQEIILDPSNALIKFNAQPLLVESERIVSNQTEAFYASLTTGFAKIFRDSTIIMDSSKAFSGYGFPSYMDITALENVTID